MLEKCVENMESFAKKRYRSRNINNAKMTVLPNL